MYREFIIYVSLPIQCIKGTVEQVIFSVFYCASVPSRNYVYTIYSVFVLIGQTF